MNPADLDGRDALLALCLIVPSMLLGGLFVGLLCWFFKPVIVQPCPPGLDEFDGTAMTPRDRAMVEAITGRVIPDDNP